MRRQRALHDVPRAVHLGRARDDDGCRAAGPRGQGAHRRPALLPDPLRSRHDRPRRLASHRQRKAGPRADAGSGDQSAAAVDLTLRPQVPQVPWVPWVP